MEKDPNQQDKKAQSSESDIKGFKDDDSGENIPASRENTSSPELAIDIMGSSNTLVPGVSDPHSTSSGSEWASCEIPILHTYRNCPISNPFPGLPLQLMPFLEKLEYERECLLKADADPDEAMKTRWYNITSERNHLFRITYCQTSRFDVAEDIHKLEQICNRILREAVCPDPIMGYLRKAINQVMRLAPLATQHLLSVNGHQHNLSAYPSHSAELINSSCSEFSQQIFPSTGDSQSITNTGSLQSAISRTSTSSDSGPSANTGAIAKARTSEPPKSLSPASEKYFSPRKYSSTSSKIIPCVPVNSSDEMLSIRDSDKHYGSLTEVSHLVFEFADDVELGMPESTEISSVVQSVAQDSQTREESRSPVRFYLGSDDSSDGSCPGNQPYIP